MLEDSLLIWKLKCGHEQALVRVYEKYKCLLLKIACALLNNRSTAEDVVHDVFLTVIDSMDQLRANGSLKGFLIRCTVNRVHNLNQAAKVRETEDLSDDHVAHVYNRPDKWVERSEELDHLHKAFEQLPYEQREVIALHLRGASTFKQIAQIQGVSINTAHSRYRYGIKKLKVMLNGEVGS